MTIVRKIYFLCPRDTGELAQAVKYEENKYLGLSVSQALMSIIWSVQEAGPIRVRTRCVQRPCPGRRTISGMLLNKVTLLCIRGSQVKPVSAFYTNLLWGMWSRPPRQCP